MIVRPAEMGAFHFVVLATLRALAGDGAVEPKLAAEAIRKYGIDPEKSNPHYA